MVVLTVIIVIISILLVAVVLLQKSKGGGLAAGMGGGNALFGAPKTTDFLEKATWTLMAIVAIICICCTLILGHSGSSVKGSAIEAIEGNAPVLPETVGDAAADEVPGQN